MADRYFVASPIDGSHARLTLSEAHHLAHVMRAAPGDLVTLFDGSGAEFDARVERVGRADVELAVLDRREIDREAAVRVTLGVALPKPDRQRWLVEKATELGVWRLVPLVTVRASDRVSPAVYERLRRGVIEASKQCGRNRLMEIEPAQQLDDFLAAAPPQTLRLLAHPDAPALMSVLDEWKTESAPSVALAIGPEGGFMPEELEAAAHSGWQAVGCGPRILRVETAALSVVAAIVTRFDSHQNDTKRQ